MSRTSTTIMSSPGLVPAYVGLTPSLVNALLVNVLERVTGLGPGRVLVESETRPRPGTHEAKGLYCTIGWKLFEPLPQNVGDFTLVPQGGSGELAGAGGLVETGDPGGPGGPDGSGVRGGTSGPEKPPAEPATLFQHLVNETWCVLNVSFWGAGALDNAAKAVSALQNTERQFDLWRTLGFGGVGAIKDESAPSGARFKPVCFFDLSFYACFGASYPADWFDVSQWEFPPHIAPDDLIVPDPEPCPQKP